MSEHNPTTKHIHGVLGLRRWKEGFQCSKDVALVHHPLLVHTSGGYVEGTHVWYKVSQLHTSLPQVLKQACGCQIMFVEAMKEGLTSQKVWIDGGGWTALAGGWLIKLRNGGECYC